MSDEAKATVVDPTEILATQPKGPTREQTLKTVQDKYPGHISWASDRANFSGCRIVRFTPHGAYGLEAKDAKQFAAQYAEAFQADEESDDLPYAYAEDCMNLYFSTRANLLIVDKEVYGADIVVLITTQLDDDDLEEFQEVQVRVQLGMREWHEARAKRKEEERAKMLEERRLISVGRNAETYNLAGRLKELEKENAALRKELNRAD